MKRSVTYRVTFNPVLIPTAEGTQVLYDRETIEVRGNSMRMEPGAADDYVIITDANGHPVFSGSASIIQHVVQDTSSESPKVSPIRVDKLFSGEDDGELI